jgi:hypothetical protein
MLAVYLFESLVWSCMPSLSKTSLQNTYGLFDSQVNKYFPCFISATYSCWTSNRMNLLWLVHVFLGYWCFGSTLCLEHLSTAF